MKQPEENIPALVDKVIRDLVPPGGAASLSDDHKVFRIVEADFARQDTLDTLRSLDSDLRAAGLGSCSMSGAIGGDHDITTVKLEDLAGDKQQVVINKMPVNGSFYFFQLEGLASALRDQSFVSEAREVKFALFDRGRSKAEAFPAFATVTAWYLPWGDYKPAITDEWKGLHEPRKLVHDLTASGTVPNDIRPWLLREPESPGSSSVYKAWQTAAAKHLAFALPLEIKSLNGSTAVTVKGDRYRTIRVATLDDEGWQHVFDDLHRCALWVYQAKEEAESKHTVLNYHLALQWSDDKEWPDRLLLEKALSNAESAYKFHLLESSKEFLKSLTELRNSLQAEVARVSENTRSLAANLWRDFAIAAGVAALQFVTGEGKLSPSGIRLVALATALFISISLTVALTTNWRFHGIAQNSRDEWRNRVYRFVSDKDFEELVAEPIRKGLWTYRFVAVATGFVYLVIVFYLVRLALF